MSNFNIKIKGLDEAIAKLDTKKFSVELQNALDAFGQEVVTDAKTLAPVDTGQLKQSINVTPGQLSVTISVNRDYAAYQEFGTRAFASSYVANLPEDWQKFAAQFKGKPGNNKGIPARPYLYPSIEKNRKQLIKDIENILT
jgi:HK97 gp10 family phage protein